MFRISRRADFIFVLGTILADQTGPACRAQEANASGQHSRLIGSIADGAGDPSSVIQWNVVALETTRAAAFNPLRETGYRIGGGIRCREFDHATLRVLCDPGSVASHGLRQGSCAGGRA